MQCHACGQAVPATAKFCPECGAPQRQREAERRQLSVLFCDLVGSTELSRRLDAEHYRELVLAYQKAAAEVIGRYEGHIAQYLGDGLLVYFGYPVAHEDDAERAVRCGYDILAALKRSAPSPSAARAADGRGEGGGEGVPLSARIGIHTGNVVIGQMGAGARSETLAMGDTTNIAARVQGFADPDAVVISGSTLKLVPGLFITKELGLQPLKGIERPLPLHQVIQPSGVRSRLEAAEQLTPFVGREAELALINDRWSHAQDGKGQAVLITAEPGMGKSRLLLMIHDHIKDRTHTWLECRASPMTQGSAYQPIIELLQRGLQIREGDDSKTRLYRLEQALDASGVDKVEAVPLIAPLLNLTLLKPYEPSPYGPELKREKTMQYLIGWLLALAKQQPLVLALEDLHWWDPSSIELLEGLIGQMPTVNILVLMTGRPEFQPRWPARSHLCGLSLQPLPHAQVAAMLGALARKPMPPAVMQRIQRRASGIPLFVEEITRQLLESGQLVEQGDRLELEGALDQLSIPATLHDSLMARLDQLGPAKEAAQLCAVVGREIPHKLLALVAEQDDRTLIGSLRRLTDSGLLYQRGVAPDATYLFKHALIQDTAYESLLRSKRAELHGRIAAALATHFSARAQAEPAVLAEHFEKAGDAASAVKYLKRASEDSAARSSIPEALAYSERALALLRQLPESTERDRKEVEILIRFVPWIWTAEGETPRMLAEIERARTLRPVMTDPLFSATILGLEVMGAYSKGRFEEALSYSITQAGVGKGVISGYTNAATAALFLGRFAEAARFATDATRSYSEDLALLYARLTGHYIPFRADAIRAWSRWALGFPDEAMGIAVRTQAAAERIGIPLVLCNVASLVMPTMLAALRKPRELLEAASSADSLCQRYGDRIGRLTSLAFRGYATGMLGHADEGLAMLRESIRTRETPAVLGVSRVYGNIAEICIVHGRLEEAREAIAQGFDVMATTEERIAQAELWRLKGELQLAEPASPNSDAEACFHESLRLARAQHAKSFELRTATRLARLWHAQGRPKEARDALQPVYDLFTEGFDTPDLREAKLLLGAMR